MEIEEKYKKAFLEEAFEIIEKMNNSLLELENDFDNEETINELFRYTHSLKSEAGLIGFNNIADMSHKLEDLFDLKRNNSLELTTDILNMIFLGFDYISEALQVISDSWEEPPMNKEIENSLKEILEEAMPSKDKKKKKDSNKGETKKFAKEKKEIEKSKDETQLTLSDLENFFELNELQKADIDSTSEDYSLLIINIEVMKESPMKFPRAFLVKTNLSGLGEILTENPSFDQDNDDDDYQSCNFLLRIKSDYSEKDIKDACNIDEITDVIIKRVQLKEETVEEIVERAKNLPVDEESKKQEHLDIKRKSSTSKKRKLTTVRVELDKLESMGRSVSELIINRSKFTKLIEYIKSDMPRSEILNYFEEAENELFRITDEVQNTVSQLRMIPIGTVFNKFPRVVRDIAQKVNKEIELVISGDDTEIDKTIIEEIQDPITHIIRNSVDHGIESPDARKELGKPIKGRVSLIAYHEGSSIVIEVSDDGKGLNLERIREKAYEQGLITDYEQVTEDQLKNFMFKPGFSTKGEVTSLSGRGVGLDVVKEKVDKLRGKIEIQTEKNLGTTFRFTLPLSLSVQKVLLVKSADNYFSIPIYTIENTDRVPLSSLEKLDDYDIIRHKGEIYSVIYLSDLVNQGKDIKTEDGLVYIVIVKFQSKKVCLLIDELKGEQDIVLNPLDDLFEQVDGVSGVGILGDASISLVLNVSEIVREYIEENAKVFNLISQNSDIKKVHDNLISSYEGVSKNELNNASNKKIENNESKQINENINDANNIMEFAEKIQNSNIDKDELKENEMIDTKKESQDIEEISINDLS